ncbi:MAG: polymer-forming cytoskeletal protein [Thermoanaerobaculales bacterium]|nr:polymer-forming cytoskeletal protein [Thermoanaerobaculales bacterium]
MVRGNDALNGFVDADCVIRGELEFKQSFRLDGRLEGQVKSASELLVGESGSIDGEIEVARCVVGGEVRGTIRATEQVVLHASAKVWAEIFTPALVMEEGAFLEGKVKMEGTDSRKTTTARKALAP